MGNILLALGCNKRNHKIEQIAIGTKPWSGIRIYDLSMINPKEVKIKDAHIGFNGDLIVDNRKLKHVTTFNVDDGSIIRPVNYIIRHIETNGNIRYLITNGVDDPKWVDKQSLIESILNGDYRLSNAKLTVDGSEYTIEQDM